MTFGQRPPPQLAAPPVPLPPLLRRTALDQQMAWSRRIDPRSWGVLPWLAPILALALVIVASQVAVAFAPAAGAVRTVIALTVDFGGEIVIVAVVVAVARRSIAAVMPWPAALGFHWVSRIDWLPWITGVGIAFGSRLVVAFVAAAVSHGTALRQSQNIHLGTVTAPRIVLLLVLTVLVAPPVEELTFRGLILRTFLRRLSFWPSAILSSTIFALFHVYEVSTLTGAATLAAVVFTLGMTNCYLVRITGRLTPGIMVHATMNLLATLALIAQSAH